MTTLSSPIGLQNRAIRVQKRAPRTGTPSTRKPEARGPWLPCRQGYAARRYAARAARPASSVAGAGIGAGGAVSSAASAAPE